MTYTTSQGTICLFVGGIPNEEPKVMAKITEAVLPDTAPAATLATGALG